MKALKQVRRTLLGIAVAALVAGGAVVLLGVPVEAHGSGHHEVVIKQYMFMPAALEIEQGETVTWTNQDTAAHDVTVTTGPTSFHSPLLAQGKSWSHTFSVPGSYSYICSVHPEMKATVTVAAATPVPQPASVAPSTSRAVAPAAVTTAQPAVRQSRARAQAQPVTTVTRKATAPPTLVSAPQSSATLQPLILVVGAAVAVVMFCLLLMASRPVLVDDAMLQRDGPKHLDDA